MVLAKERINELESKLTESIQSGKEKEKKKKKKKNLIEVWNTNKQIYVGI